MANQFYPYDLEELASYTDPILTNGSAFVIPSVPGVTDSKPLTIQVQSVGPAYGFDIQNVDVNLGRFVYKYAGALKLQQELNVTFLEMVSGKITTILETFRNSTVNYNSGLISQKANYSTTGYLYVQGTNNGTCMILQYNNLQLRSFSAPEFIQNNGTNEVMKISATFVYDYLTNPIQIISS